MTYFYLNMHSPLGILKLIASNQGLVAILWPNDNPNRVRVPGQIVNAKVPILNETVKQLREYFDRKRNQFNLALDIQGTTFQKQVWNALLNIPYSETSCYLDVATSIGKPNASRAVGTAISRNPLSIIIPCHRVIATNGNLAGFAGGLTAKAFLLKLENETRC